MEISAKLEALLFYYGDPISVPQIARMLNITEDACSNALLEYEEKLKANERGFVILRKGDKVQLATKPELKEIGEMIVKDEFREQLTPAALETLALVAYLGPVTRATIDYIRGVNSAYSMRNLSMRGLVERGEEKGASFRYIVTEDFLKHIGLKNVSELPEYEKYHTLLESFARTAETKEEKPEDGNNQEVEPLE